jgi:hypothetical protein
MKRVLLLSCLLSFAVACGSDSHSHVDAPAVDAGLVDAAPSRVIADTKTMAVTASLEGTFTAKKTDRIVIKLTSDGPIDWNVHGHANGVTTVVYGERGVMTATYEFVPPADGDWFLILTNKATTAVSVQVHADVYGTATFIWN